MATAVSLSRRGSEDIWGFEGFVEGDGYVLLRENIYGYEYNCTNYSVQMWGMDTKCKLWNRVGVYAMRCMRMVSGKSGVTVRNDRVGGRGKKTGVVCWKGQVTVWWSVWSPWKKNMGMRKVTNLTHKAYSHDLLCVYVALQEQKFSSSAFLCVYIKSICIGTLLWETTNGRHNITRNSKQARS